MSQLHERYGYLHHKELGLHDISNNSQYDPSTYNRVVIDVDSLKWYEDMQAEIDLKHVNQVWILVDCLKCRVPVMCKWIYKGKNGIDGKVETYISTLLEKGYT